jgi:uncharacterized protein YndB with AHSA1/START domain
MQDVIERELVINASQEKIYDAITNPELVVQWFPDAIEGTYAVGEQPIFDFSGHGKSQIYVVEARPFEYFSYRWVPCGGNFIGDVLTVANTLVEFTIQVVDEGVCKVFLKESGFSSLQADFAEKSFKNNSGGWDFMLARLQKFFTAL